MTASWSPRVKSVQFAVRMCRKVKHVLRAAEEEGPTRYRSLAEVLHGAGEAVLLGKAGQGLCIGDHDRYEAGLGTHGEG